MILLEILPKIGVGVNFYLPNLPIKWDKDFPMGDMFDNDNYCSKSIRACQLLNVMLEFLC